MSLFDHDSAPGEMRSSGYFRKRLAGYDDGFELTFDYHVVDPGSGALPHFHTVDEIIVVLEGIVDATLDGEVSRATKNQSVAIPKNSHHGFTVVGSEPAKLLIFFPVQDALSDKHTTYL